MFSVYTGQRHYICYGAQPKSYWVPVNFKFIKIAVSSNNVHRIFPWQSQGRKQSRGQSVFIKFFFDGKSYKLSQKKRVWLYRFNRSNKTVFYGHNYVYHTLMRKKGYIFPFFQNSEKTRYCGIVNQIRKSNTYTIRGIYTSKNYFYKRQGRISEYI